MCFMQNIFGFDYVHILYILLVVCVIVIQFKVEARTTIWVVFLDNIIYSLLRESFGKNICLYFILLKIYGMGFDLGSNVLWVSENTTHYTATSGLGVHHVKTVFHRKKDHTKYDNSNKPFIYKVRWIVHGYKRQESWSIYYI